jgi:hypothetical protein
MASMRGETLPRIEKMIDAEMYGMMPRANSTVLPRAAPEKALMRPNADPPAPSASCAM